MAQPLLRYRALCIRSLAPPSIGQTSVRQTSFRRPYAALSSSTTDTPASEPEPPNPQFIPTTSTLTHTSADGKSPRGHRNSLHSVGNRHSSVTRTIKISNSVASPLEISESRPYTVARTPSGNLSVYKYVKRGGNLKLTFVKKITGSSQALADDLKDTLTPKPEEISVNGRTTHVIVKGHYKEQIAKFLTEKGF